MLHCVPKYVNPGSCSSQMSKQICADIETAGRKDEKFLDEVWLPGRVVSRLENPDVSSRRTLEYSHGLPCGLQTL